MALNALLRIAFRFDESMSYLWFELGIQTHSSWDLSDILHA
jgi:hypothetical protein